MVTTTSKVGCGAFLAIAIVIAITIGVSFDTLDATEVGLDYNPNSKKIDETTM